jgi:hypothetical protein
MMAIPMTASPQSSQNRDSNGFHFLCFPLKKLYAGKGSKLNRGMRIWAGWQPGSGCPRN